MYILYNNDNNEQKYISDNNKIQSLIDTFKDLEYELFKNTINRNENKC